MPCRSYSCIQCPVSGVNYSFPSTVKSNCRPSIQPKNKAQFRCTASCTGQAQIPDSSEGRKRFAHSCRGYVVEGRTEQPAMTIAINFLNQEIRRSLEKRSFRRLKARDLHRSERLTHGSIHVASGSEGSGPRSSFAHLRPWCKLRIPSPKGKAHFGRTTCCASKPTFRQKPGTESRH